MSEGGGAPPGAPNLSRVAEVRTGVQHRPPPSAPPQSNGHVAGRLRGQNVPRQLRSHWIFILIFAVGAVARAATVMAYRPAMELVQDSFSYLGDAAHPVPDVVRPDGYSFFLRVLSLSHHFTLVPITQHLMGLSIGLLLYLLLVRLGAPLWLAALGSVPILLDGAQIYVEQFVLAETLFEVLVVVTIVLVLWRDRPKPLACAAAGVLVGAAALTRSVGLALLIPLVAYLVIRRVGWRPVACLLVAAGVVLLGYAGWFKSDQGSFGIEAYDGYFLAGRVEPFMNCAPMKLPPLEQPLCDHRPVKQRPGTDWYVWNPAAPLRRPAMPAGVDRNAIASDFAKRAILHQPLTYVNIIWHDLAHYFSFGRTSGLKDNPVGETEFATALKPEQPWQPESPPTDPYVWEWTWPGAAVTSGTVIASHGFALQQVKPRFSSSIAKVLHRYQDVATTPGPLLALATLLAAVGVVRPRQGTSPLVRWAAAIFAIFGVLVLVTPAAFATFDYRYLLPALALLPPAGVLGVMLIFGGPRRERAVV